MLIAALSLAVSSLVAGLGALVWVVKIGITYGTVTTKLEYLEKLDEKVDRILMRLGDGK